MSHIHRESAVPRFFEVAVLLLAISLLFAASKLSYAGDQDGVSGYKIKIYYQSGDVDSNVSGYQGGNGTPLLNSGDSPNAAVEDKESINLTAIILYLRGLLLGRFS